MFIHFSSATIFIFRPWYFFLLIFITYSWVGGNFTLYQNNLDENKMITNDIIDGLSQTPSYHVVEALNEYRMFITGSITKKGD